MPRFLLKENRRCIQRTRKTGKDPILYIYIIRFLLEKSGFVNRRINFIKIRDLVFAKFTI